jgi:hypothetical protein
MKEAFGLNEVQMLGFEKSGLGRNPVCIEESLMATYFATFTTCSLAHDPCPPTPDS